MTLNEFVSKYEGKSKGYPTDTQYLGECLSLAKLYIKECFSINPPASGSGSAYGYWSNFPSPLDTVFEKITNTDTSYPLAGDIIIWQPWSTNQYGHISICLSGNVNSFISLDQNWGTKNAKRITHDYKNVVGYLRSIIKPVTNSDTMTTEEKILLDFIKTNQMTEGQLREGFAYVKDGTVAKKDEQILILTNKVTDLEVKVVEITATLENLRLNFIEKEKNETRQQKLLDSANAKLNEQILKVEELDKLAKDNRNLYLKKNDEFNAYKESGKQETVKSLSLLQFIKLKFKK